MTRLHVGLDPAVKEISYKGAGSCREKSQKGVEIEHVAYIDEGK